MSDADAVVRAMVTVEELITGVRKAYSETPDGATMVTPCFVNRYRSARIGSPGDIESGFRFGSLRRTEHYVDAYLCLANNTSPSQIEKQARPYLASVVSTFDLNKTLGLGATSSGMFIEQADITEAEYGEIPLRAGDPPYVGWRFAVRVVEMETGSLFSS